MANKCIKLRCLLVLAKTGGCVINTCGWVDGGGYKVLLHAAKSFEGNIVEIDLILSANKLLVLLPLS